MFPCPRCKGDLEDVSDRPTDDVDGIWSAFICKTKGCHFGYKHHYCNPWPFPLLCPDCGKTLKPKGSTEDHCDFYWQYVCECGGGCCERGLGDELRKERLIIGIADDDGTHFYINEKFKQECTDDCSDSELNDLEASATWLQDGFNPEQQINEVEP